MSIGDFLKIKTSSSESSTDEARARKILGPTFYADFEAQYRDLKKRPESWDRYSALLVQRNKRCRISDLGAGRGNLIDFLRAEHPEHDYLAIEPDSASCAELQAKGILARKETIDEHFESGTAQGTDIFFCLHVIEHLTWNQMVISLAGIFDALKKGGFLVLEIPNTWSILTSSVNFWADPSHIRPVVPSTLDFLLKRLGFIVWEQNEYSPHLSHERYEQMVQDTKSPELVKAVFGKQDIAFICQKPEEH